jgi:hypothetical protein
MKPTFKKSFIEKCVKAREELNDLRRGMASLADITPSVTRDGLQVGDFFYHESMGQSLVKKVFRIEAAAVSSEDGRSYPKDESSWIPTRDQLIAALEEAIFFIRDPSAFDEEGILELYKETHDHEIWNKKKRDWIKIKN